MKKFNIFQLLLICLTSFPSLKAAEYRLGLSMHDVERRIEGGPALSFEKILGITDNVNLWLNPGFQSKTQILRSHPKSRLLKPLKLSSVFCYSHNTNKYWELSACRPDLILSDYAEIKKGSQMEPDNLFFYQRVQ